MKKLSWLLVVALFVLPGCGKTEVSENTTTSDSEDTTVSTETTDDTMEPAETDSTTEEVAATDNEEPAAPELPAPTIEAPETAPAEPATERKVAGDWPMWGGSYARNMYNTTTGISIDFEPATDPAKGKKVMWVAALGSQTYGNPVVADGHVLVGTNNGAKRRPKYEGDKGVLMAFDAKSGEFKWQLTRDKLPDERVNDWPEQGICSTPCTEKGRIYVVTNRCELQCIDLDGFYDGENDGPYKDEVDTEKEDADIIWSLDMMDELGVFPHNLATSSPVLYGDKIFITTSNGVDEAHLEIPSPRAPSFLAVNKNTGKVVWEDNSPEDRILHGQWSSPAVGVVNGKAQVYMPGGDGWLYAFDAESNDEEAKLLWKFDLNPKDSVWELGGAGTRNAIIATPVFSENSVILAVGQDPEHAEGVGHIYRIDATKTGDVSPMIDDGNGGYKKNSNSGEIWHFGGIDEDGSVTGEEEGLIFRRTLSTVSIYDGLVYAADLSGFVHCLDFANGKRYWEHDTLSGIWGSTLVADGKVFIGDEDGELSILKTGKKLEELDEKVFNSSVYSTPTIANGILYVSDRSRLYAIDIK
ncbi:MAG: PQQ-binding-like beta-propeller repeat protein [Planctomycetaceae bacterium]